MKRKTSILINIASLCLCIGALVVGVISAKTVTASLSGSIGFKAYNATVEFQGKIEGARINDTAGTYYIKETGAPTTTATTFYVGGENSISSSVSFGSINFDHNEDYTPKNIVFIFSMTNKSQYDISAKISLSNINLDPSISYSADEYMVKIAQNATGTIKVTLSVSSATTITPISNSSVINFTFEKFVAPATLASSNFTATYDSSTKQYTITNFPAKTTSTTLTIPAYFYNSTDGTLQRVIKVDNNYSKISNADGYQTLIFEEGITELGGYMIANVTSLKTVQLPCSLTKLNMGTFKGCSGLTSINIPPRVSLSYEVFGNCIALSTINIPNGVYSVDGFSSCTGLTSIELPASVARVQNLAFSSCTNLATLTIRGNANIDTQSFSGCTALKTVIIDGDVTTATSSFGGCTSITAFYIKSGKTPCTYITNNYSQASTSDRTGYVKYTKNS